ncbi:MAG: tRNA pseudouridine(38-40) synthase TruA [Thermoplasmata archaeon]
MYLLLKFAYLGSEFEGYQMQPDKITVEGEILKVLKKYKIAGDLKSASRTDRGVSAMGNVIKIETEMDVKTVFGILNSQLRNIYFYSYAITTKDFNPRIASERFYKYYFLDLGYDLKTMKACAHIFLGTHDFIAFSKADGRNSTRTVKRIVIKKVNNFYVLEIVGESFMWNMVRRIVGAIQQVGLHKLDIDDVKDSLHNKKNSKFIVDAENLILMDVKYSQRFRKIAKKKMPIEEYEKSFIVNSFYKELLKIEGKL